MQYINTTYRRTGTLWEGRHKGSLVEAERYLLACYRYVELNPVRAAMVAHPGDYRWSSYRHHAYGERDPVITDHEAYLRLGHDWEACQANYRELFNAALDKKAIHTIRTALTFSMPLGNDRFKAQIERVLGRSIGYAKRGKPTKSSDTGIETDEKPSQMTPTP